MLRKHQPKVPSSGHVYVSPRKAREEGSHSPDVDTPSRPFGTPLRHAPPPSEAGTLASSPSIQTAPASGGRTASAKAVEGISPNGTASMVNPITLAPASLTPVFEGKNTVVWGAPLPVKDTSLHSPGPPSPYSATPTLPPPSFFTHVRPAVVAQAQGDLRVPSSMASMLNRDSLRTLMEPINFRVVSSLSEGHESVEESEEVGETEDDETPTPDLRHPLMVSAQFTPPRRSTWQCPTCRKGLTTNTCPICHTRKPGSSESHPKSRMGMEPSPTVQIKWNLPSVSSEPSAPLSLSGLNLSLPTPNLSTSLLAKQTVESQDGGGEVNPEEEADIHFKPVVSLPETYEVTRGEEEEDAVFTSRAKLYRFDGKEWKERGVGELKMLRNRRSGKVRLVMRRDQVLKICCNHFLSADMTLHPMASSDRAWTWFTSCEFSEGEARAEKLAARFKNAELALKFKEAFEKFQWPSSPPTLTEHARSWMCSVCGKDIPAATKQCLHCTTESPDTTPADTPSASGQQVTADSGDFVTQLAATLASAGVSPQTPPQPPVAKGADEVKTTKVKERIPVVAKETDEVKTTKVEERIPHVSKAPQLPVVAKETDEVIITKVEEATPEQKEKAKKLQLPINFYLYLTRPPCPGCRGCTDNFNATDPSTDLTMKPRRMAAPSVSTQEMAQPAPNPFGSFVGMSFTDFTKGMSTTFNWMTSQDGGFKSGGQIFGRPEKGDECDGSEVNPEEEADIHFKPVVSLPETYEVKRGEEEEDALFASRAKLYRFDGKEWKERGVGELKMLRNRRSGKVRLVMRRDQVLKICCNHFLSADMTLHPMASSDRAWTWFTSCEFSEGEARAEKLAARFKNAELALKFKEAFVEAQKYLQGPPELVDDAEENSADAIPDLEDDPSVAPDDLERPPAPPIDRQVSFGTDGGERQPTVFIPPTTSHKAPIKHSDQVPIPSVGEWECVQCQKWNPAHELWCVSCRCPIDRGRVKWRGAEGMERVEGGDSGRLPPKDWTATSSTRNPFFDFPGSLLPTTTAAGKQPERQSEFLFNQLMTQTTIKPSPPSAIVNTTRDEEQQSEEMGRKEVSQSTFGSFAVGRLPTLESLADKGVGSNFEWMKEGGAGFSTGSPLFSMEKRDQEDGGEVNPEEEADIHFKPVVSLPETYEVKRGEEEEDVVFKSRAKLYRHDGQEWKERGVGELKMLRSRRSGKVRLVMRRDQVLKICCNHFLSADMTLHPMASSDRAWTWFTSCEFSEGEARAEKLAARFKNAEMALKFKEAFETNARPSAGPQSAVEKELPQDSSRLSTLNVAQPSEDSWSCPTCLVENAGQSSTCPCCGTARPGMTHQAHTAVSDFPSQGPVTTQQGAFSTLSFPELPLQPPPAGGGLNIPFPSSQPPAGGGLNIPFPSSQPPGGGGLNIPFPSSQPPISGGLSIPFPSVQLTAGGGQAVPHSSTQPQLVPGGAADVQLPPPHQSEVLSGSWVTDEVEIVKVDVASPEEVLEARKHQLPDNFYLYLTQPPCSGCRGCTDNFNGKDQESTRERKRRERKESTLDASAQREPVGAETPGGLSVTGGKHIKTTGLSFSWMGEGQPGFSSSTQLFASLGHQRAEGDPGDGNEVNPEEEADIHFKPVVSLPETYEVKRGEEEEDALFTSRAKLYRFDGKEWKERGVGELKMLRNRRSGKVRLVMRRDQVLKICCNHFLSADMTLHPMASSDRAWTWFTSCEFSEGEARAEKLAARFKSPEIANEFKVAFSACIQNIVNSSQPAELMVEEGIGTPNGSVAAAQPQEEGQAPQQGVGTAPLKLAATCSPEISAALEEVLADLPSVGTYSEGQEATAEHGIEDYLSKAQQRVTPDASECSPQVSPVAVGRTPPEPDTPQQELTQPDKPQEEVPQPEETRVKELQPEEPQPEEPEPEEPQEVPKLEEPKPEEPQPEEPQEVSKPEAPQPEEPKPEEPQPEEPQLEEPQKVPKPEAPQPEEPQAEETQPEEPQEVPKLEAPQPEEPQPEEPQPEEPQEVPKPEAPQPEEPQPEEPQAEETRPEEPQEVSKPEAPQPEEPQPEEPQPEEPQLEEPQEVPKPEAPQPEEPQPEEPQPEEPQEVSKPEAPQPEEPQPEEPQPEEPQPEETRPEEPQEISKPEVSQPEEPQEVPKPEAPQPEEPQPEEPQPEAPQPEEPQPEEPQPEEPQLEEPQEVLKPEEPQPEEPQLEEPQPEEPQPEETRPEEPQEVSKPDVSQPEEPQEVPKPEAPQPEEPQPEEPKPEEPQPEEPQPEEPQLERPQLEEPQDVLKPEEPQPEEPQEVSKPEVSQPEEPQGVPKPEAPQPEEPKPEEPQPEEPQDVPKPEEPQDVPKPEEPQAVSKPGAPQLEEPQPEEPQPEEPQDIPKPEEPQPEEPQEVPKPEGPQLEEPQEVPKPEAPQPEEPQLEEPQPEEPQPEEPQLEEPQPEEPQEVSKPEAPQLEEPQPEKPQPEELQEVSNPEEPQPEEPQPEELQEVSNPEEPQPEKPQPEEPQEVSKPEEPQPEEPQLEEPQPEEPQPEKPQPEEPQEVSNPEEPQPEEPQPEELQEVSNPEEPQPEEPQEVSKPKEPQPEEPQPEEPQPEEPQPEKPQPEEPQEVSKPEEPQPEEPQPEKPQPEELQEVSNPEEPQPEEPQLEEPQPEEPQEVSKPEEPQPEEPQEVSKPEEPQPEEPQEVSKPEEPQPEEPQPEEPQPEEPQEVSKPEEPQPEEPQPEEPQEVSKPEAPQPEEPLPEEPQEVSKPEEPQPEEPQEVSKPEAPQPEEPQPEEPQEVSKPEAPQPEEPQSEEPLPEEPQEVSKPEAPQPEEPQPEEPQEVSKPEEPQPEEPQEVSKPEEPQPEEPLPEEPQPEETRPEEPQPEEPQPEEPLPEEPQLEESQPEEPQLEEPQPEEPQEVSKPEEPQPEEPLPEEPQLEESQPEEPQLEEPQPEEPQEVSKPEVPQPEEPLPEEPQPEETRPEEPQPEEPQPEEPQEVSQPDVPLQGSPPSDVVSPPEMSHQDVPPLEHCIFPLPHSGQQGSTAPPAGQGDVTMSQLAESPETSQVARGQVATPGGGDPPQSP